MCASGFSSDARVYTSTHARLLYLRCVGWFSQRKLPCDGRLGTARLASTKTCLKAFSNSDSDSDSDDMSKQVHVIISYSINLKNKAQLVGQNNEHTCCGICQFPLKMWVLCFRKQRKTNLQQYNIKIDSMPTRIRRLRNIGTVAGAPVRHN